MSAFGYELKQRRNQIGRLMYLFFIYKNTQVFTTFTVFSGMTNITPQARDTKLAEGRQRREMMRGYNKLNLLE